MTRASVRARGARALAVTARERGRAGGPWPAGRLLLTCVVLACLTGCAHVNPWRDKTPPPPLTGPVDDEPAGPPYADSLAVLDETTVPVPPDWDPAKHPGGTRNSTARGKPRATTPPEAPLLADSSAVPQPDSIPRAQAPDSASVPSILSEDIPPEEMSALIHATVRDRDETEAMLRTLEARTLTGRGGEQLRTIQALMKASQEAGDRSEYREAASLAHKAWLLAVELSGR